MAGKKALFPRIGFFLLVAALIGGFLFVWFQVGLWKWIDEDEFAHLHAAWLVSQGQLPYRDFFYFYSPVILLLLGPILLLGQSFVTVYAARLLMLLVSLATLGLIFLLGKSLRNARVGALAVLTAAVLPVWLEKAVEIRPDNPALLFYLVGLILAVAGWRQRNQKMLIGSGAMLGLAAITILKMAFGALALGFVFFMLLFKERKSVFRLALWWAAGFAGVFLAFGLVLFAFGVLSEGIYSIFQLPREVFSAYGWQFYQPNVGFEHNNPALFGGFGKNISYLTNVLVWGMALFWLALLGVLRGFGKAESRHELVIFIGPPVTLFGAAIIFLYNMSLLQYFLPLVPLIAISFADFSLTVFDWLKVNFRPLAYVGFALLLLVFYAAFWKVAPRKYIWRESLVDLELLKDISAISQPDDPWFDMTGRALFRPDGYYVCCAGFPLFAGFLSRPLPNFTDSLIANQNKFIIGGHRINLLSVEERGFLAENYLPLVVLEGGPAEPGYVTLLRQISVAGKKMSVSGTREFFLITSGPYRVFWQPESVTQIRLDGRAVRPGVYMLSQGDHRVVVPKRTNLTIIYDYQRAREEIR